jgi:hypothetical protein
MAPDLPDDVLELLKSDAGVSELFGTPLGDPIPVLRVIRGNGPRRRAVPGGRRKQETRTTGPFPHITAADLELGTW